MMNPHKIKWLILAMLAISFFVVGFFEVSNLVKGDLISLIHTLLVGILIFSWFHFDSHQHAYPASPLLKIAIVAVTAIALPYYFFRSRGAKNGLLALFISLMVLAILGLSWEGGHKLALAAHS